MKKKHYNLPTKDILVDKLSLPRDVVDGVARVTLTGNEEVWIENYRGILEYTEKRVLLQTKTCHICFEGSRLTIEYYTNEDMKLKGNIQSIHYL